MAMKSHCDACQRDHDERAWRALGMVCGRCGEHTGDHNQGHFTTYCTLGQLTLDEPPHVEPHFCCPSRCHRVRPLVDNVAVVR